MKVNSPFSGYPCLESYVNNTLFQGLLFYGMAPNDFDLQWLQFSPVFRFQQDPPNSVFLLLYEFHHLHQPTNEVSL